MPRVINTFTGAASRPDPDEVGSRYNRNILLGPDGSYFETRPGSRQLTRRTQPGYDAAADGRDQWYEMNDDELAQPVLIIGAPGGDGANLGDDGLPRLVLPLTFATKPEYVENQNAADIGGMMILMSTNSTVIAKLIDEDGTLTSLHTLSTVSKILGVDENGTTWLINLGNEVFYYHDEGDAGLTALDTIDITDIADALGGADFIVYCSVQAKTGEGVYVLIRGVSNYNLVKITKTSYTLVKAWARSGLSDNTNFSSTFDPPLKWGQVSNDSSMAFAKDNDDIIYASQYVHTNGVSYLKLTRISSSTGNQVSGWPYIVVDTDGDADVNLLSNIYIVGDYVYYGIINTGSDCKILRSTVTSGGVSGKEAIITIASLQDVHDFCINSNGDIMVLNQQGSEQLTFYDINGNPYGSAVATAFENVGAIGSYGINSGYFLLSGTVNEADAKFRVVDISGSVILSVTETQAQVGAGANYVFGYNGAVVTQVAARDMFNTAASLRGITP